MTTLERDIIRGVEVGKAILRAFVFIILALSLLMLPAAAQEEGAQYDHYLLLVIDGPSPSSRGWAEPVILSHNRADKIVIADSLDCNKLYDVGGRQLKMGDIYAAGGESLVIGVVNSAFGLGITRFAKTTYSGLGAVAKIMGGSVNTQAMIDASKSSDRSVTRREQLNFMAAVAGGLHKLSIERVFSLISASFAFFDTNISLSDAYNLASDIMGGTFLPHDGKGLGIRI